MKKKYLIPLVLFFALVFLLGYGLTRNPKILPSTFINQAAPEFSLENVTSGGGTFNTQQLLGQQWVLNVWASWCVACRVEHPLFNQLAGMKLAPIVGLNYKDQVEDARQWLRQRGNPYQATPSDISGRVGIEWGVVAVPETFIIDEQGIVIYKHTGPINPDILTQDIVPLLKQTKSKQGGQ